MAYYIYYVVLYQCAWHITCMVIYHIVCYIMAHYILSYYMTLRPAPRDRTERGSSGPPWAGCARRFARARRRPENNNHLIDY